MSNNICLVGQGSGKKPYFTKDTQKAIAAFCAEPENYELRADLYRKEIKPALEKLAENLIFVYGFHKQHDDVEHLKHSCVINLYENLHKFATPLKTKGFTILATESTSISVHFEDRFGGRKTGPFGARF